MQLNRFHLCCLGSLELIIVPIEIFRAGSPSQNRKDPVLGALAKILLAIRLSIAALKITFPFLFLGSRNWDTIKSERSSTGYIIVLLSKRPKRLQNRFITI